MGKLTFKISNMKNLTKASILFAILVNNLTTSFAGGPWPQKQSEGYFKLYEWWTVFDQHYTDAGLIDPNITTGIFNTSIYAEYGISDRFTVIGNMPIFSRNIMNNLRSNVTQDIIIEGEALNSIGDFDLAFKYGLTQQNSSFPIAMTLTLGLPTGAIGKGEQGNLQTGDGEFNQMLQIDFGKGFRLFSKSSYFSSYVGINNRTNGFSEEFRAGGEFGIELFKNNLWATARWQLVESFKNGATTADINNTSVFANNTEFSSIGFELNYFMAKKWGLSVGVAGAYRGEIIAAAPSYSVGIFYSLNSY